MQIVFYGIKNPEHYKSANGMACYSCAATEHFISFTRNCDFDSVLESYVSDSSLGEKTEETSTQMTTNPIGRLCNSNSIINVYCFVANR